MAAPLQSYISSFSKKLSQVNAADLSLAPYPLSYLQSLLNDHLYYLHIYAHVLDKLLENINKPKEDIIVVDYGAGNGLLGIFAKHCGFGYVYLNDHSSIFLESSRKLAAALEIFINGFVQGDWNEVADHFKLNNRPDAVIGTDVIEHIYNLESFFLGMQLLNADMVTVFTTASVTSNPFKSKQLMRLQYNDEHISSNAEHAMPDDEYAGLSFLEIRKRIIQQHQPQLRDEEVNEIAVATRGMNKQDITAAVNKYIKSNSLPEPLIHPTNTCDPVSGSWTERLLTLHEYENIYNEAGFALKVYNGFYNQWQHGIKSVALNLINKTIALSLKQGKFITPFITLVGKKK